MSTPSKQLTEEEVKRINEAYRKYFTFNQSDWLCSDPTWKQVSTPTKKPRKKRVRSPEKTKAAFLKLITESGYKKELPLAERVAHVDQYGQPEDYTKGKAERENKRLCGICGDPRCPYSD